MNHAEFTPLLDQLETADWQRVIDGESRLMVDDLQLAIGPALAPNAIIGTSGEDTTDAVALRQETLKESAHLLNKYDLTHPLTLTGFNHQVVRLIERHGAAAFAALPGQLPQLTLFADESDVVAEPAHSPRHRYGVYCVLTRPEAESAMQEAVSKRLQRGEAHERYLSINVCRYNC